MKKFVSLIIAMALMLVFSNCAYAQNEKIKLSVWSFTPELQGMIEKYYLPNHPELDIEFQMYPTDRNAYQNKVDKMLDVDTSAISAEAPDIFTLEATFVKEYVNSNKTGDLKKIGFTDQEISSVYPVVAQIGQNDKSVQKALSWQSTPGVLMYRDSLAKKYLGVNSPAEMQSKVADWDSFVKTAEDLNQASNGEAKMVTGIGDIWQAYQFSRNAGWVVDGKLNVDKKLLDYAKMARTIQDEDLSQNAGPWGETWFAGMRGELETMCYFLPTWGLHYTLKPNCVADWDNENPDSNENIRNATENGTYGDWRISEGPQAYSWGGTWLGINAAKAVASDDAKKAAMHDLIKFFTMDEDFQMQYFADCGDFVSNKNVAQLIMDNGGVPYEFLGGQDYYAVFASAAEKVDGSLVSEYDAILNDLWNRYVTEPYARGEVDDLNACVAEFREQAKAAIPSLIVDASEEDVEEIVDQATKQLNAFVERNYEKILGRTADEAGKQDWVDQLKNGEISGGGLMHGFVNSDEFKNKPLSNQEKIEIMYNVMLDRPSDPEGMEHWLEQLGNGMSINAVAAGFVGSQEFKGVCVDFGIDNGEYYLEEARDVNAGVTGFVNRCYTEALGRGGEPEGLNNWCGSLLAKAQTPQEVAHGFVFSAEMDAETKLESDPDALLDSLYRLYLGREADPEGKASWKEAIANGMGLEELNYGFAQSSEFNGIVEGYGLN